MTEALKKAVTCHLPGSLTSLLCCQCLSNVFVADLVLQILFMPVYIKSQKKRKLYYGSAKE